MIDAARKVRTGWLSAVVLALLLGVPIGTAQAIDWTGSVADLSAPGQDAYIPQLGLSADGSRATAVWTRYDGSNLIVQSRSATITGTTATWGPTTDLSAPGRAADGPQIGLSADGTRATAVWFRSNGTNLIVQSRSATITGTTATWGPVTDLSIAGQDADGPQIGLSADGTRATAVWYRYNGTHYIVQSRSATITDTTAAWGPVSDLSAAGQHATIPQVGVAASGGSATAVWTRSNGTKNIVQSRSATITGTTATWGPTTDLSAAGQNADAGQVAVAAGGTAASAVWFRFDGSHARVQSRSATITGDTAAWGPTTDLSANGATALEPQVAVSADGTRSTAVWRRFDGSTEVVQSRSAGIVGNAASWGSTTDLSASGADAGEPQVGLAADGRRATAVWFRQTDGKDIVQSRSAAITGDTAAWGTATDLSAPGHSAFEMQVGVSADGTRATSIWRRNSGSDYIVQSRSASILSQTITFPAPADTRVDAGPVPLTATSSSGLPVTLTTDTPAVCTVSGATATLLTTGTCTITARQAGSENYAPAPDVTRSFTVAPIPTPGKPGKPTSVKATSKKGTVKLTWVPPAPPLTGYLIQFSTNKKKWKKAGTAGPTAKKFLWKKGKKGKKYHLRLRASSNTGNGPWSKPVKVKVR